MQGSGKWPFNSDAKTNTAGELNRAAEQEHARMAAEALHQQHLRHDRLIVGGKAHTKKHGLS